MAKAADAPPVNYTVEFPYTRSLGPVVGAFLTGLRDQKFVGAKAGDRVFVPPVEHDPDNGKPLDGGLVEVGPDGVVTSWCWVTEPTVKHPLQQPFAFALVQLDGATTSMLHAVDARIDRRDGDRDAREAPLEVGTGRAHHRPRVLRARMSDQEEPLMMDQFVELPYHDLLSPTMVRYSETLVEGTILGQQCPQCGLVFVPPRGYCPIDTIVLGTEHDIPLKDTGVVSAYTIVTPVQYHGQKETEPFVRATILLDEPGGILNLQDLPGVPNDEVHTGMRVQANWVPESERGARGPRQPQLGEHRRVHPRLAADG